MKRIGYMIAQSVGSVWDPIPMFCGERRGQAIINVTADKSLWRSLQRSGHYKTIPIYADPKDLSLGVPAPTKSVTKHKG